MRARSRVVVGAIAAVSLAGAYPAYAWVCHPDPPGTRTLVVVGDVDAYSMGETHVDVAYRDADCTKRVLWNIRGGRAKTTVDRRAPCGQGTATSPRGGSAASIEPDGRVVLRAANGSRLGTYAIPAPLRASHAAVAGDRIVILARGTDRPDRPDRALLLDARSGEVLHSWPLLDRPTSLDVSGDLALFGTAGTLYALRLSNGRIGLVGLNRPVDTPQIETAGVVYMDDLFKPARHSGKRTFKFIPTRVVARRLVDVAKPLVTRGPINAFAMDATRVGVVVDEPDRACDRVVFWNVPWHFNTDVTKLLMPRRLTCPDRGGPRISQIAFGGVGLEWVAHYGGTTKLLTATLVNCDVRVVASGEHVADVAGDGGVLAYALGGRAGAHGTVAVVSLRHHHVDHSVFPGRTLAHVRARSLAADAGRIATLDRNGRIELRASDGRLLLALHVPGGSTVALRGNDLVALAGGRLHVFDAESGRLAHVWSVSALSRPEIDVHFGVAAMTVGRNVLAVDLATGRRAVVARAAAEVHAQIEAPGIAYRYNADGRGFVRFVPFAQIERALGRSAAG
jgi:hypothetical protein